MLFVAAVEDRDECLGCIRLHKVKDASRKSLIPAIKDSIQPKSEVHTYGWAGYSKLSNAGYKHAINS